MVSYRRLSNNSEYYVCNAIVIKFKTHAQKKTRPLIPHVGNSYRNSTQQKRSPIYKKFNLPELKTAMFPQSKVTA